MSHQTSPARFFFQTPNLNFARASSQNFSADLFKTHHEFYNVYLLSSEVSWIAEKICWEFW